MNRSTLEADAAIRPRPARASIFVATVLTVTLLLLYLFTLCPTVYISGTGENITAAATLGVPHPPGFPLFCLLGRVAVVALPVAPPVAINGLAALCMALAAGVLAWLMARWSGSLMAGAAAGALFGVAHIPWSQAVIGEVYGLSALLLALELALLLAWRGDLGIDQGADTRRRLLLLFAFVLGLGVSVHPLHVLMVPGYLLLALTTPQRRMIPRLLPAVIGLAVVGFSLHLYAPLRSAHEPTLDWGDPDSLDSFWRYLTASQYRERMFSLGPVEVLGNLKRCGALLIEQWTAPALVLPLAGLALMLRRRRAVALALLTIGLADLLYAINYDIPWEIEVYYIPLVMMLALAGGMAVAWRTRWTAPLAGLLLLLALWSHHASAGRRGIDYVDRYGRDLLEDLPRDAVLITPPTNPTFILLYLTTVEGARPDVDIYVNGKQGLVRLGEALDDGERALVTAWTLARDAARPLHYVGRDPLDELPGFELVPAGVVYRVEPVGQAEPAAEWRRRPARFDPALIGPEDDFRLRLIAAHYLLVQSDHAISRGDTTAARIARLTVLEVAGDRAEIHGDLALRAAAEGDRVGAIASYRRALERRRDDVMMINRLGRLLHEEGDREGAERAFRRAIELEPDFGTAHSNLGALLGSAGDVPGAIAALRRAIDCAPLSIKPYNNLGMALLKQGDRAGAAAAWRQSLTLNPSQPNIARLLARVEQR